MDGQAQHQELLRKYAEAIVRIGLNLRAGQRLIITNATARGVPPAARPLVHEVARAPYAAGARFVDVIWGDEGAILLFPLFALIALAIRIDSKGPVIFPRRVMGMNGRQFEAYKFRTMYINSDEILEKFPKLKRELFKNHELKDDPRVTRIGRFLRSSSLDELPQLLNVLKRDMSLVGPRIISPEEIQNYSRWDLNLLTVKPGISGLWQVSGRSDISYEERVRLDMHYIRNWSIWCDLEILIRTVPAVIKRTGAY